MIYVIIGLFISLIIFYEIIQLYKLLDDGIPDNLDEDEEEKE